MKNILRKKAGFTLIELLVVIAVVGVLAGAVVAMINPDLQFKRARNAQRKSDIRQIANALEQYLVINGAYPLTGAAAGISTWCDTANTGYFCSTNPLQVLVSSGYLKKLPIDPMDNKANTMYATGHWCLDPNNIGYLYRSDNGTEYKIIDHCGPEGTTPTETYSTSDSFYDPNRPTWSWQISTPGANALGW